MIATSCCWGLGMTLVIRKKFSARRFWPDCKDTGATICQYIGELCGYLLDKYTLLFDFLLIDKLRLDIDCLSFLYSHIFYDLFFLILRPAGPEDRDHKLRVAIGNGLRAEFWPKFVTRFNIPQICMRLSLFILLLFSFFALIGLVLLYSTNLSELSLFTFFL